LPFRQEFQQWARAHNIHNLSVLLHNSFCIHRLAQTGNPGRTASEVGLNPGPFQKRFEPIAAGVTDSGEYFSFTPRKVGLRNWPRMVKEYLAEDSGRRRWRISSSRCAWKHLRKPLAKLIEAHFATKERP
jgi:hypothetical protein